MDNSGKIKIDGIIVVEGKHDKIKLSAVTDAKIISVNGFGIFNDTEKRTLLRRLSAKSEIIIMTDSDGAGNRIRSYLKGFLGNGAKIINVHIPAIRGKEARKSKPSAEGTLGVEGLDTALLASLLSRFCTDKNSSAVTQSYPPVTKTDFFLDGLAGTENCSHMRELFCTAVDLPPLSANALLEAVNILFTYQEYKNILSNLCR